MAEHEKDIVSQVRQTEAWKKWGSRYERHVNGRGEEPFARAEGYLVAIPPDTYDSLILDLREGIDTAPFSELVRELTPLQIGAVLDKYNIWQGNRAAVMQFWKKAHEEGSTETSKVLQQSENWEKYKNTMGFIEEGYPFQEGFPSKYLGKKYELIQRDGKHVIASVDDSTHYRSEGLAWRTPDGEIVYKHVVVAWREHEAKDSTPV